MDIHKHLSSTDTHINLVEKKFEKVNTNTCFKLKHYFYKILSFVITFIAIVFAQNALSRHYVQYCTLNVFNYIDSSVFITSVFTFIPTAGSPVCKYVWILVDHTHNIFVNLLVSLYISSKT